MREHQVQQPQGLLQVAGHSAAQILAQQLQQHLQGTLLCLSGSLPRTCPAENKNIPMQSERLCLIFLLLSLKYFGLMVVN